MVFRKYIDYLVEEEKLEIVDFNLRTLLTHNEEHNSSKLSYLSRRQLSQTEQEDKQSQKPSKQSIT